MADAERGARLPVEVQRVDGEERARLRARIARDEQELRAAVGELRSAARERIGLGPRLAEHPAVWLVGGLAVGLWLGWRRS